MTELLFEAHELLAQWVAARIDRFGPAARFGNCTAIGILRDKRIVGAVIFSNFRGHDMEVSIATEGQWATRGLLKSLFSYPFGQCGCARISALVARSNKKSRKLCESLGFKLEGVMRKSLHGGTEDACIYGMLREECRWFQPINVVRHGDGNGQWRWRQGRGQQAAAGT